MLRYHCVILSLLVVSLEEVIATERIKNPPPKNQITLVNEISETLDFIAIYFV